MMFRKYIVAILSIVVLYSAAICVAEEGGLEESVFNIADESDEPAGDDSIFSKIDTSLPEPIQDGSAGYYSSAKLVIINKITAKSRQVTLDSGKAAFFDNMELKLHKCWKSSDVYVKNNQILVTMLENKFDEDPKLVFQGWLISGEPALSTFEHPVYEVLASECVGSKVNKL